MQKFYLAHAMVLDNDNNVVSYIYCGAFFNRCNAYKNIKNLMDTCPDIRYLPSVKLGEILDAESNNVWDWRMVDIDLLSVIDNTCVDTDE